MMIRPFCHLAPQPIYKGLWSEPEWVKAMLLCFICWHALIATNLDSVVLACCSWCVYLFIIHSLMMVDTANIENLREEKSTCVNKTGFTSCALVFCRNREQFEKKMHKNTVTTFRSAQLGLTIGLLSLSSYRSTTREFIYWPMFNSTMISVLFVCTPSTIIKHLMHRRILFGYCQLLAGHAHHCRVPCSCKCEDAKERLGRLGNGNYKKSSSPF